MIGNDHEYRVTNSAIKRFEDALAQLDERSAERHPLLQRALRESIESELHTLREQVSEYEALRDGQITVLELNSLAELPDALIRARIATGLTQKALAARLGLKEQQIQRYEATRYAGASLSRVQAVADALGLRIHKQLVLPTVGE